MRLTYEPAGVALVPHSHVSVEHVGAGINVGRRLLTPVCTTGPGFRSRLVQISLVYIYKVYMFTYIYIPVYRYLCIYIEGGEAHSLW